MFTSGVSSRRIGVVIEVKRCEEPEDMYDAADAALKHIRENHCIAHLERLHCRKICTYGLTFCRRDCVVTGGVLKRD